MGAKQYTFTAWPHCSPKTYLDILQNITLIHYTDDKLIVRPNEQEGAGIVNA